MTTDSSRPGEVALGFDPAQTARDASVVFIGRIRSPWKARAECPRNLRQARERGCPGALVLVEAPYRDGLVGLEAGQHIWLLYWMNQARRDLIVQAPKHRETPAGTFALRSPVRPNPIAMAAVLIEAIDHAVGRIEIDAIDCLDGTPLIDIKPWLATVDVVG